MYLAEVYLAEVYLAEVYLAEVYLAEAYLAELYNIWQDKSRVSSQGQSLGQEANLTEAKSKS